jgi:uncharacterized membrane protein YqaE (UPF0057 family)
MEVNMLNIIIFVIGFEIGMLVALWMDLCRLRSHHYE